MKLLQLFSEQILFESYDDELVMLDLSHGVYYTVSRGGGDCLQVLLHASDREQAITLLLARFDTSREQLEGALSQMTEALKCYGLVRERAEGEPGAALALAAGHKLPFAAPVIEQYKDVEEILMFDPIHEVEENGWPNVRN